MPTIIRFMRSIGKSPMLLADADAFTDDKGVVGCFYNDVAIHDKVTQLGHKDIQEFVNNVFTKFSHSVESYWNDIAPIAMAHPYWLNNQKAREDLRKRRAVFAVLFSMSEAERNLLNYANEWNDLHRRLLTLLNLLESAGCFILRKGTIEMYYQFANNNDLDDKPELAIEEVQQLLDSPHNNLLAHEYEDVIRALKFAASIKPINEAELIEELLNKIISPALAKLSRLQGETNELEEINRRIQPSDIDITNLFSLKVIKERNKLFLELDLESKVLDIQGFPIRIQTDSNPVTEIKRHLNLL